MRTDPLTIPLHKVEEALRVLGLNPVDMDTIKSVAMATGRITVVRYALDAKGKHVIVDTEDGPPAPLTETVEIGVELP